ncbi:hypothetical protein MKEN_00466700 [Mycena kentingensis (nom. inval.)]|nr:hypothetical protein MKEN_00466700 [Mycena kentingensis (nom. inval.)]
MQKIPPHNPFPYSPQIPLPPRPQFPGVFGVEMRVPDAPKREPVKSEPKDGESAVGGFRSAESDDEYEELQLRFEAFKTQAERQLADEILATESANDALRQSQDRVKSLKEQLSLSERHIAERELEIQRYTAGIVDLKQKLKTALDELQAVELELGKANEALQTSILENQALESAKKALESKIDELQHAYNKLQNEAAMLAQQKDALAKQTRSEKLSYPPNAGTSGNVARIAILETQLRQLTAKENPPLARLKEEPATERVYKEPRLKEEKLGADDANAERTAYLDFMAPFPRPSDRKRFEDLRRVGADGHAREVLDYADTIAARPLLFLRKRTVWCNSDKLHAIAFSPTKIYHHTSRRWLNDNTVSMHVGKDVEFFVQEDSELDGGKPGTIYYVGVYRVHSMRKVHKQGSVAPADIEFSAIMRAMGLSERRSDGSIVLDGARARMREVYPDGEPRTECFGLQCVGWDGGLFGKLRERFKMVRDRGNGVPRAPRRDREVDMGSRKRKREDELDETYAYGGERQERSRKRRPFGEREKCPW